MKLKLAELADDSMRRASRFNIENIVLSTRAISLQKYTPDHNECNVLWIIPLTDIFSLKKETNNIFETAQRCNVFNRSSIIFLVNIRGCQRDEA